MDTQLTGPVRVRFPPSPTGYLHVGGARTAIYNDLLRRSLGGAFVLRIEDTDRQRSDAAMTAQIESALRWLGVEWDEGPTLQSEGVERHRATAYRLVEEGKAYRDFLSAEELESRRQAARQKGESFRYQRAWSELPPEEEARRVEAGEPHAIRFAMPKESVHLTDLVRGEVEFPIDNLEDFIILRSDGTPTYHLSVVCDDILAGVDHIIRGDDHLTNTAKHICLYHALGERVPVYGHLPLILGMDKKPLSKRKGAASVEEFRDQGILRQALFNYLALLGWSPGGDREIMTRAEMVELFTVERLGTSAAVFDPDKLAWMNAQYMSRLPYDELLTELRPFLGQHGLEDADGERLETAITLHRTRARTLLVLAEAIVPYFRDRLDYQPDLCAKFVKQENLPRDLAELSKRYSALEVFDVEGTEAVLRQLCEELGAKAGYLIHPARMALSGTKAGPSFFDLVVAMGQEACDRHIGQFVEFLGTQTEGDG